MSGLFGQPANNTTNPGTSLFGANNNNNNQTSNLFSNPQTNANPGSSLFGTGNANNITNPGLGGGLFGGGGNAGNNTNNNTGASMFGGAQNTTGGSILGSNSQPAFGNPNPQSAQPATYAQGGFSNNPSSQQTLATQFQGGLGHNVASGINGVLQQELLRSRLQASGIDPQRGQKTVFDQAKTLISKWDPQSQDTLLQAYMYNSTTSVMAPYHTRNLDEDEKSWEAALAEKPAPINGPNGMQTSFVPVLCRGFKALEERVDFQARAINDLRARLHEMNNCLTAVMNAHQQRISVQLETARRQHAALSQRSLRLAVKVQVLRNRGYNLGSAEEDLRRTLVGLEAKVLTPTYAGREEQIWARMVALRERSRWLAEEGRRIGQQVQEQQRGTHSVPEDVLQKTKKILQDYEGQLAHLNRELKDVEGEYEIWKQTQGER